MKINFTKKPGWQTIFSVLILALFTYLAAGYVTSVKKQARKLDNGNWEVAEHYSDGHAVVYQGPRDKYKRFDGLCTREHLDADGNQISIEKGTWKMGRRHGPTVTTFRSGLVKTRCYEYGKRVDCDEKSAKIVVDQTAFEMLVWKYPWYNYSLNAFGYNDDYIKSFMDTLETILYAYEMADELKEDEFSDYYGDAINDLAETPYDSLIQKNQEHVEAYGFDLILNTEFRLATFDRYLTDESSMFTIVKNNYPNYLQLLEGFEITENDFAVFCHQYDSVLTSYGQLDINDDYFGDSVDNRIYRALDVIGNQEEDEKSGSVTSILLNSLDLNVSNLKELKLNSLKSSALTKVLSAAPKDVAGTVFLLILSEYTQADLIMLSAMETYNMKSGIIMPPTLSTDFVSNNSSSSVTLRGNVISDGGGEISKRGVVWSKGYNPLLTDEMVDAGAGVGEYEATIDGLTEGETYYARSFATNSSGTAYGNIIEFTATTPSGINDLDDLVTDFVVYPNPASDKVMVRFNQPHAENLILTISDVQGRLFTQHNLENLNIGENQLELNVSEFDNGIYFCNIQNNKLKVTRKFMVQR